MSMTLSGELDRFPSKNDEILIGRKFDGSDDEPGDSFEDRVEARLGYNWIDPHNPSVCAEEGSDEDEEEDDEDPMEWLRALYGPSFRDEVDDLIARFGDDPYDDRFHYDYDMYWSEPKDEAISLSFSSTERESVKPTRAQKDNRERRNCTTRTLWRGERYNEDDGEGHYFRWTEKRVKRIYHDSHGLHGRKPAHEKHHRVSIRREARVVDEYYVDSYGGYTYSSFVGSFVELRVSR